MSNYTNSSSNVTSTVQNTTDVNNTLSNSSIHNYTNPSPSPWAILPASNVSNASNASNTISNTTEAKNNTIDNASSAVTPSPQLSPSPETFPTENDTNTTAESNLTNSSDLFYTPSPTPVIVVPSPSPSKDASHPSPSFHNLTIANNETKMDPFRHTYEETVDFVVGGIIIAVVAFYCLLIFYPQRCEKLAKFTMVRQYSSVSHSQSNEQAYGRVKAFQADEDDLDNIELAVAFKDEVYTDSEEKTEKRKNQMENDLEETML